MAIADSGMSSVNEIYPVQWSTIPTIVDIHGMFNLFEPLSNPTFCILRFGTILPFSDLVIDEECLMALPRYLFDKFASNCYFCSKKLHF